MATLNDLFTAGQYFLTITIELVILFIGISFLVGLIQEYVPEEKIRRSLTGRHPVFSAGLGAIFGALTPFCSCSTIPVLVGLIRTRVPFGACMAYLFASPLLNPIIVFMVLAFFGMVPTAIYAALTFLIAVLAGLVLERSGYLRYVKPAATGAGGAVLQEQLPAAGIAAPATATQTACCASLETGPGPSSSGCCSKDPVPAPAASCCPGSAEVPPAPAVGGCCGIPPAPEPEPGRCCDIELPREPASGGCSCNSAPAPAPAPCRSREPDETAPPSVHRTRLLSALRFAFGIFRQVVPYLLLGAAIGAFIYGFVPEDLIVSVAGPGNPLAIPVAAVIGVPMYIRAETIIPISAVLLAKGMGIGAIMALIIGGAGASIPEVTLLASIFQRRLVAAFVATVMGVAIVTGILMQILQTAGVLGV
ncbi:MAG: permease [Methanomicrobiales archaeon]|nr:permease [Methanomicrobiales archaeon]